MESGGLFGALTANLVRNNPPPGRRRIPQLLSGLVEAIAKAPSMSELQCSPVATDRIEKLSGVGLGPGEWTHAPERAQSP